MLFTKFFMVAIFLQIRGGPNINNVNLTLLSYVSYVIDYGWSLQYALQILASFTLIWYF